MSNLLAQIAQATLEWQRAKASGLPPIVVANLRRRQLALQREWWEARRAALEAATAMSAGNGLSGLGGRDDVLR